MNYRIRIKMLPSGGGGGFSDSYDDDKVAIKDMIERMRPFLRETTKFDCSITRGGVGVYKHSEKSLNDLATN